MDKISSRNLFLTKERKALTMLLSVKLEDVKYLRAKIKQIDDEIGDK